MPTQTLTRIDINFKFGECNGFMNLEIRDKSSQLLVLNNIEEADQKITLDLEFPNVLEFVSTGKNLHADTKLDKDNNIIADKFVKLLSMNVGYVPVNQYVLQTICKFQPKNAKPIYNLYWYTNGKASIEFNDENFLRWHLRKNYIQLLNQDDVAV